MNFIKIIPKYRVNDANNKSLPRKNNKKKTTDQYKEELKVKNPDIEVLEEYLGANIKILHKCAKGHIFQAYPTNILRGHRCKICSQTKTHEQYVLELQFKSPTIEILDKYAGTESKNTFRCLVCNNIWEATPSSPLRGKGCPECRKYKISQKLKSNHTEYEKKLSKINTNVKLLEQYKDSISPIKTLCLNCDNIWSPIAHTLLQGHGCPICSRRMDEKDFLEKIDRTSPTLILLDNFSKSREKYSCQCKKCMYIWTVTRNRLIGGKVKCPFCESSYGEQVIYSILTKYDIKFVPQKTYTELTGIKNGLLSYDFYLIQYNLLVEFQGIQHEKPIDYFGGEKQFKIQQEHDKRKHEYAKQNNINLLEIWYYDIDNIESILLQKINKIKNNLKLESLETAISA